MSASPVATPQGAAPVVAPRGTAPHVVALGGGHGLAATLMALRRVTPHVTAVVTVADDGGSSGRLRKEFDCLPPGDLRMALAALAATDGDAHTLEQLLQHRFTGDGSLAGHAAGNLLILALSEVTGDVVQALAIAARMVEAVGTVLPASTVPLEIVAQVAGLGPALTEVVGQVAVAITQGDVRSVSLRPANPPACPEALKAIHEADWVVFGPGSWFTSVLPHLLIPQLRTALEDTPAHRLVALNLAPQKGETEGFSPREHLEVLRAHAPELRVDVVLADRDAVADTADLTAAAATLGARLALAPVAIGDGTPRHDPVRLAQAYHDVLTGHAARRVPTEGPAWR